MGKSKSGRKKVAGVTRTPSGRRSRAASAQQENAEPILTRMRLFGLSEKDARDQKAATFIGRLQLTKVINQAQYDAAVEFLAVNESYHRAIKAPEALRSSSGGGDQGESEQYTRWCRTAIERYDAALASVRQEQNLHRNRGANLYAALNYVVTRDEQLWHMVGDTRLVLNALAHHFGIVRKVFVASVAA
jgi:hypothetical protein